MYHERIEHKVIGIQLLDNRLHASNNETLDDYACVSSDFSFKHVGQ